MIVAQLLFLEAESSKKPIHMYINSPGGGARATRFLRTELCSYPLCVLEISAGLAIYDTMQFIEAPVSTLCVGQACSMASLLLAAGRPGLKRALPNSYVMIHQPLSGTQGQASDLEIHARHLMQLKRNLIDLYVKHTNKPFEVIGMSHRVVINCLDTEQVLNRRVLQKDQLIEITG